jgi:hypothetical protein
MSLSGAVAERDQRSTEDFLMIDNLVHNEVLSQYEFIRAMVFSLY